MPKPVLQAMVLADHVYQDRATGKHVICGTFTAILFSPFKAAQNEGESRVQVTAEQVQRTGSPYLYLALVGVHGTVPLALKFVDLSDARVLFEAQVVITATDPVGVVEYIIPLPILPARQEGNYSLDLLHDDEILGSWRVSVRRVEESGAEQ
jgi:hypothetical protein